MMVFTMKWLCHQGHDIMTKAIRIEVNTVHVVLVFAEAHLMVEDILYPVAEYAHIQTFTCMPYFVGLAGMYCLKERRPLKAIIPSSTERFLLGL